MNKLWNVVAVLVVASLVACATADPAPAPTSTAGRCADQGACRRTDLRLQPPRPTQTAGRPGVHGCNPRAISWSTIAGSIRTAMTSIVKDFESKNCVKVTIVGIDNAQLYDKQISRALARPAPMTCTNIETAEKAGFCRERLHPPDG